MTNEDIRSTRIELGKKTIIEIAGKQIEVKLSNVSFGGLLIESEHRPEIGEKILLEMGETDQTVGTVIRHADNGFAIALLHDENAANYALKNITGGMIADEEG